MELDQSSRLVENYSNIDEVIETYESMNEAEMTTTATATQLVVDQKTFTGGADALRQSQSVMLECINKTDPLAVEGTTNAQREHLFWRFWFTSDVFKYQKNPVLIDPILPTKTNAIFDFWKEKWFKLKWF